MKTKIFNITHIILFVFLIIGIIFNRIYLATPKSSPIFILSFGILIYTNIILFIFRIIKSLDNSTKKRKIFNYMTIISLIILTLLCFLERIKFVTANAIAPIFYLLLGVNIIALIARLIFTLKSNKQI